MAIDKSDYEYTIEEGDSLIKIAERHGLKPITDWARKIWEDNRNLDLYIEADMHGKKVKRQLHLGSNHYEPYEHFRYGSGYRGYDNPSQIILYAGEKIWIPKTNLTDRIIHEMTDDELINGFVPEFGKRYRLIFPAMKIRLEMEDGTYSENDKYTLSGYNDMGELIYKKTLTVKEDSEDNNGIKELVFNATPKSLKYKLELITDDNEKKRQETTMLVVDTTYNKMMTVDITAQGYAVGQSENVITIKTSVKVKTFFGVCLTAEEFKYEKRDQTISIAKKSGNAKVTAKTLHRLANYKFAQDAKFFRDKDETQDKNKENNEPIKYEFSQLNKKCMIFERGAYNPECKKCKGEKKYCDKYSNNFLSEWVSLRINRDYIFILSPDERLMLDQSETRYKKKLAATEKMAYKIFLFIKLAGKENYLELMPNGSFEERKKDKDIFQQRAMGNFNNNNNNNNNNETPIIPGVQQYYILLEQKNNEKKFQISRAYCDGDRII